MGAGQPRDLNVPGRDLGNVMFAWDFLTVQNKLCSGESLKDKQVVNAKDKSVIVIGGGDTGSDCVGTSRRQGAKQIYQLEILPKPPGSRAEDTPWPLWPRMMRTSSSHQEGCERLWSVMTKELRGKDGNVNELVGCKVEWVNKDGRMVPQEVKGSEFILEADLVLLAMGYVHVVHEGIVNDLGLETDQRGNIIINNNQTSKNNVFAAGDAVLGASLVVRAIESGRNSAESIDIWLKQ
jgi:NADPH-dependent glutamate synthase beta subunit-like oxidoreductase